MTAVTCDGKRESERSKEGSGACLLLLFIFVVLVPIVFSFASSPSVCRTFTDHVSPFSLSKKSRLVFFALIAPALVHVTIKDKRHETKYYLVLVAWVICNLER